MSDLKTDLSSVALVNLLFAQAEIESGLYYEAAVRAIEHLRQAEASLQLLLPELAAVPEETEIDETAA
jgi:hypothetical protein